MKRIIFCIIIIFAVFLLVGCGRSLNPEFYYFTIEKDDFVELWVQSAPLHKIYWGNYTEIEYEWKVNFSGKTENYKGSTIIIEIPTLFDLPKTITLTLIADYPGGVDIKSITKKIEIKGQ